jgi:hypothetical protein
MKSYIYQVLGNDCYKVVRINDKYPVGHKDRFREYLVDLKRFMCDPKCEEYWFSKPPKTCHHLQFIVSQLKDGGGILCFENNGDYDRLVAEVTINELKPINKNAFKKSGGTQTKFLKECADMIEDD